MRASVVAAAVLSTLVGRAATGEVANGSFESGGSGSGLPTVAGTWSGDVTAFVSVDQGITPFEGVQMVRFIYTSPNGPNISLAGSELWQLIDMSDQQDLIGTGLAVLHAAMVVNRIPGDEQTDTQFTLGIYAYAGTMSGFPSQWPTDHLDTGQTLLETDALTETWEPMETTLCLPVDTDYVAVHVAAIEDIFNDGVDPEFDGHYGDLVTCELILGDDGDGDGTPDVCETCPWDCGDQDGTVATADLLALLGQWGGAGSCDFDGDGVNTADLLKMLGAWGDCP